ncbi:MAG: hypothetical protein ACI4PZ_04375 [Akkermansia sp.]
MGAERQGSMQQMQREAVRKTHRFSPEAITEQRLELFRHIAASSDGVGIGSTEKFVVTNF